MQSSEVATPDPSPSRPVPDTLLIISALAVLMAIAVAFITPGKFAQVSSVEGTRQVSIALESFEYSGEAQAVPLFAPGGNLGILNLPFEGLVSGDKFGSTVGLAAFLLILGGAFGVLMRSGAIDRTLTAFVLRYQRRAIVLIPGLFVLFSLGGAIFGMSEETIPFVLLLTPIFRRLGLDGITAILVTFVATQIGFATSWMNPFSVIVAQGVSGLPPLSGMELRIAMWALFTAIGATLSLRYALAQMRAATLSSGTEVTADEPATGFDYAILLTLIGTIAWVGWGVSMHGYYIPELAAQFFTMGLVTGIIAWLSRRAGMTANALTEAFRDGAAQLLPVVLIVAAAKALILLLGGTDPSVPSVMNTLLYGIAHALEGLPASVAAWFMLLVQSGINFLVPSGSGQAALTMPIMAPLGDLLGVSRQVAVLAFQLGDGLTNLLVPTSAILMGVLGAAGVDWVTWARFMLRWMIWLFGLASVFVVGAVWMGFS